MDLEQLNSIPHEEAVKALLQCCGSKRWAENVANTRPYSNLETLITNAHDTWWALDRDDWIEAFHSHPKIGEKKAAAPVSDQSRQWSGQEQAGVAAASRDTVDSLAALNWAYEQKFGFIFIICATGKTSDEMLESLKKRLENDPETELPIAAAEQSKITELRLKKLTTNP
jgi:OHCU decarboxylase